MILAHPKDFAIKAHGDQKYGDEPYSKHLEDVVNIARCWMPNHIASDEIERGVLISAAWLHDVLEDTDVEYKELNHNFGNNIALLVWAVTDEPGKNRKERKAKTLPKIRKFGPPAVFIKVCDRIANIGNCSDSLYKMYSKEHEAFRNALYSKNDQIDSLWGFLNKRMKQ